MVFKKIDNKLFAQGKGEIILIEPWGENCLRFRSTLNKEITDENWTLLPQDKVIPEININNNKAIIKNGKLICEIDEKGGVKYLNNEGKILLEELWIDGRINNADLLKARNYKSIGNNSYKIKLYFKSYIGEKFYGMGQYANGFLNLKGCVLELAQKNTQISIPFLISNKNYGFIWNNPSIGRAELVNNHTLWVSEASKQIDYLVISGENLLEVIKKYIEITGKPPILPEWALSFWQSKLRYRTQDEIMQIANEYKKRGLPISVIVIDFFHWIYQGDWKFDPKFWPDPQKMVNDLNQMGIKVMVSIWPTVDVKSENYREMVEKGLLVRTERGLPILFTFRGTTTYFDATNPQAREYIWNKVKENYYKYGIKMFWLDEAEPEINTANLGYDNTSFYDYENLHYYLGNGLEISNIYPFYYAKAFYDGMKSVGEEEIVNLIRCAWLGSQRFGVVVWSGDIPSTFESLRAQVKAGLNMSMCGIFYWTTDIGGFYGGDPFDPRFQELIVRWFQFGVFCPIFRLHGFRLPYPKDPHTCDTIELTGGPNEVWSFGEEVYNIIKELLFMRERIKPYIIEQMKKASSEGIPIMRPLFLDFPEDETSWEIEDEFLFGPDILVAPILYEGVKSRKIYLPKGAKWRDVNYGELYDGGIWIEDYPADLNIIPIFLKNDIKLPLKG